MKNKTWIWITAAVLVLALLAVGMLYLYRNFAPQFRGLDEGKKETASFKNDQGQGITDATQDEAVPGENITEATQDEAVPGKHITVTVVHKDGTEKEFTYGTDEQYLGTVLKEDGLIEGEDGPYGMMITAVDGEVADWNVDKGYWALYVGEQYAVTGIDQTPIHDGDTFSLVYTIG